MFEKMKKKILLMAHRVSGAPFVYFTLMAHQHMVRHCYIAMAHQTNGAPLVTNFIFFILPDILMAHQDIVRDY